MNATETSKTSPLRSILSTLIAALLFVGMVGSAGLQAAHAEEDQTVSGSGQDAAADGSASEPATKNAQTATEGTNTTPKEEVVYARLAGDGAVENAYVVNVLNPDKAGAVTDYGDYESVANLTDTGELTLDGDKVTAQVTEDSFSYQGTCESKNLPWNITITYTLDGKPTAAADLAGAEGDLEVFITTKQNKAVDASFFDNYLVQISVVFPGDKSSDVSAPDGQIALAGSNTQVTFAGMPGKDGSFKAMANVHDFEMEGISVAAVPFSMAIETPDTAEFVSGFKQLGDGVSQLNTGAQGIASGAQSLSGGISQLGSGVQGVANGTAELATGLNQVSGYSNQILEGLNGVAAGGDSILGGSAGIDSGLQGLSQGAAAGQALLSDPRFTAFLSDPANQDLLAYAGALEQVVGGLPPLSDQYSQFDAGLQQYVGGVNQIASEYAGFNDGIAGLSSGAQTLADGASQLPGGFSSLSSGASELASGAGQLSDGTSTLSTEVQAMPDAVQAEIDKMLADYDKSDYKPVSFSSPKNTNVGLTQFVIAGEPIKLPEDEKIPEPEEDGTLLSRFLALFGVES